MFRIPWWPTVPYLVAAGLALCGLHALHATGIPPPLAPVLWTPGPVLQQIGPTCVVFAIVTLLQTAPAATRGPDPLQLYAASQARDGGKPGHDGTSAETALDILIGEGFVGHWRLTQKLGDSIAWLRQRGPIAVEGPCRDMLAGVAQQRAACSDPNGVHVWVCYGVGPGPLLRCQTSWGTLLGRFTWSVTALVRTLADDGRVFLVSKRGPRLSLAEAW